MQYFDHSKLKGTHSILSASQCSWLNYTDETFIKFFFNKYSAQIGTLIHEFAASRISKKLKLKEGNEDELIFYLLEKGIPSYVAYNLNIEAMYLNCLLYVNDAIGFGMDSEVILCHSEAYSYGTADALIFNKAKKKLRIHDLKTGVTKVHEEQLMIYAAYFCHEYGIDPLKISYELRIYKDCDVLIYEPDPNNIKLIIEKATHFTKLIESIKKGALK